MKYFNISIPTDHGYFGQICPSEKCGKYFKIDANLVNKVVYCPYCGVEVHDADLKTPEQERYINDEAKRVITDYALDEIDKMFANAFRGNQSIKYTSSRKNIRLKRSKSLIEKKVDSEITCPDCSSSFQVYGIFGYCPICRSESLMIYDANISIIRNEIAEAKDQNRALRRAYYDLVSTFEDICKKISNRHGLSNTNFQNISDTRQHFLKSPLKIDITAGLNDKERLTLRRVFQKRHVYDHNHGVINEKYIKLIPEDQKLIGEKAPLSLQEFEEAVQVQKKIIDTLI